MTLDELSRFEPEVDMYSGCPCCEPSASVFMRPASYGDWVRFDDVKKLVESITVKEPE